VQSDPNQLQTKLQSVVDTYNSVINQIHQVAGYGATKGSVTALQGDSALRSVTDRMSNAMLSQLGGSGSYRTLGAIGLSTTRDGLLTLDSVKLSAAVQKDGAGVTALLAGTNGGNGVMDIVSQLAKDLTGSSGTLGLRSDSLSSRAKSLHTQANTEQDRLTAYGESLRKQFTSMDTTVASNNSQRDYLTRLFG
jgi:flagellar hook-associated protein 2